MTQVWALPGYDVQSLLGYGASGEVWRAREIATDELVALKRLRADSDPTVVEALRREAVLLRSLDTPYVIRLREILGEGAATVLVLDLAEGGSLSALLARRGRLDPGEVVTVTAPLAQALAAAHARGLVHGDVTPSNVLFNRDGMPLLADLGLARVGSETGGRVDGTAEYVDPAVASGGVPDASSDVWALAAVAHHMLAGSPPHDGGSVDAVLDAARSGSRAPLGLLAPTAPRPLVAAIESGLQGDPAVRPDAAAFAAALRRSHAAAPVRMTGVGPAAPAPEPRPTHAVHEGVAELAPVVRRRRVPREALLAVAAVLLLAVAAAGGWLSGRSSAAGPAELARVAPAASAAADAARVEGALGDAGSAAPAAGENTAPAAGENTAPAAGENTAPAAGENTAPAAGENAAPAAGENTAPDWRAVLDRLDAARAAAFATADASRLRAVYDADSPALAADAGAIRRLRDAGQTASGVRHVVRRVSVSAYDGRTARLQVVDVLSAYEVIGRDGSVVSTAPPRGEARFVVEVVRTSAGWRLRQVTPA